MNPDDVTLTSVEVTEVLKRSFIEWLTGKEPKTVTYFQPSARATQGETP